MTAQTKTQKPVVDVELIAKRLEELENRCTQLEASLKGMVTFETLAARLTGNPGTGTETKRARKPRAKREWSPEEKAAFRAKMVAGRLAKEQARQAAAKARSAKK